jgi:hypothetical protein
MTRGDFSRSNRSAGRALGRAALTAGAALWLVAAGCRSTAGPPDASTEELVQVELTQTFTLSPGQVARIGRDGPYLAFRRVSQDSRCPMDVVCVWMGDAVVQVEVGLTLSDWTRGELHTDAQQPPLDVGSYRIRLTELQPYPRSSEATDAGRYRATFQVTRR